MNLRLSDTAKFTVEVYEENDPGTTASFKYQMAAGKAWRFRSWTKVGNTYLNSYVEWSAAERGVFGYDALDRLVSAVVTGTLGYTQVYTYDAIGNLLGKSDAGTYTYPTSGVGTVRPHAVTATTNGGSFGYDANGNMVTRVLSPTTYTLVYDAENRLIQYKQGATVLASYTYDGDGTLVQKVAGGQTTVYVGPHYEKNLTTAVVTKYYYLGAQRVAMRVGSDVAWIHGDHLGSASLTTDINRITTGEMRYYPYGEARGTSTVPTDQRYTGQREEVSTGLYDYNARYYDAALGRFIQADTIVPDPRNPQMLNRYSYTAGNPIRYNDPDGHCGPLCWAGIALGLTGVALTVSASQPLPPERQPSDVQGLLGIGLIFTGLGLQAPQWLVPAACSDGDCTDEAASIAQAACGGDCGDEISTTGQTLQQAGRGSQSPAGQRTIQWVEDDLNRVNQIMQPKHSWGKLADLSGNAMRDYQSIQAYIQETVDTGISRQVIAREGSSTVLEYTATINGQVLTVRGIQLSNGTFQIADAWVKK